MAKYPIDSASYSSITCSMAAKPVINRQTGLQKADTNGEPLYSVELVAFGEDGAQVLAVKFPGAPPANLKPGVPVRVVGLVVTDWEIDSKHGLSFRAARIEVLSAPAPAAKAGAA